MAETFTLEKASHLLSNWMLTKPDEVKAQKAAFDYYRELFRTDQSGQHHPRRFQRLSSAKEQQAG